MTRDERKDHIADICSQHNCSEKLSKIHFEQYVQHGWHPHPTDTFMQWWETHNNGPKGEGLSVRVAWNTQAYRDEFMEAKKFGAVSPS